MQAQSVPDTYCNDFRNWVRTIGSDEFGESYFQAVKEISTSVHIPGDSIKVKTSRGPVRLSTPEDVMVWTTRTTDKVTSTDAEFVFCGIGINAPEYGWKDLVNPDKPNKYPQVSWYHKPNDEYQEYWDVDGTIANVNLMFSVGLSLAEH